jgi:hypothetical protein
MRSLLSLLLFAACTLSAQWQQLPDLPGPPIDGAASFVLEGSVYVGTGRTTDDGYLNEWWRYNRVSNTWTPVSPLPASPRYGCATFTMFNRGFVFGGMDADGALNELWAYNPAINTWEQRTSMPAEGRSHAVALEGLNVGIIATGMLGNGAPTNESWKYYPTLDSWENMPAFEGVARSGAAGIHSESAVMVAGGRDENSAALDDTWIYYTVSETGFWIPGPALPGARYDLMGAGQGLLVACGASDENTVHDDAWQIHGPSWDPLVQFAGGARRGGVAETLLTGGDVETYIGLGIDAAMDRKNDWWKLIRPVGIQEIGDSRLLLFPNPSTDRITTAGPENWTNAEIVIHDAVGRIIHMERGNGTTTIDVAGLAPGRYHVTIGQGGNFARTSFIKLP